MQITYGAIFIQNSSYLHPNVKREARENKCMVFYKQLSNRDQNLTLKGGVWLHSNRRDRAMTCNEQKKILNTRR